MTQKQWKQNQRIQNQRIYNNRIKKAFLPVTLGLLAFMVMQGGCALPGNSGQDTTTQANADSENFVTCISNSGTESFEGSWNNLLLQQSYFQYDDGYSYSQWVRDMRSGKTDGRFSATIRGVESTISYRSITGMPGWYVIVELANKDISDITQQFSWLGGTFGCILVAITLIYMLSILLLEKMDKRVYMGLSATDPLTELLNRRALQNAVEEELKLYEVKQNGKGDFRVKS